MLKLFCPIAISLGHMFFPVDEKGGLRLLFSLSESLKQKQLCPGAILCYSEHIYIYISIGFFLGNLFDNLLLLVASSASFIYKEGYISLAL
jgi:hypothetical protein